MDLHQLEGNKGCLNLNEFSTSVEIVAGQCARPTWVDIVGDMFRVVLCGASKTFLPFGLLSFFISFAISLVYEEKQRQRR